MQVFETPCQNCLLTKGRIVPPERAKEIVEGCKKDQSYFICHNSEDICCRKFFDGFKNDIQVLQICERYNIVQFIPQANDRKLMPFSDQKIRRNK